MAIIEDASSPSGYRNDVTGRFAKASVSTKASGAGDKSEPKEKKQTQNNLGATQIVSALRQEFSGLNKHLAFRFDSVIKAMQGTEAEKRDATIISGNTDPKDDGGPVDPPEKSSFLENLKGLNPFAKDRNPFVRILAFGALALALGSEKLQPVLAKVLEWVKETFIPWVSSMWTAIKDFDWSAQFDKVKAFFNTIKDFFMQFDADKDGKLDFDEFKTGLKEGAKQLGEGLIGKITDGLKSFVKEYGLQIGLAWAGYRIGKGLIKSLLFGGMVGVPGGPAGGAAMRVLGLAGVMVGGLYLLHNRVIDAYEQATEDENEKIQDFDATEMIARMLTGPDNKEGKSWTGAFMSAWDEALMGAGVGLAAGLVTGGILSLPLAAAGFVTGGILGIMGAKLGEDKLNAELDEIDKSMTQFGDDLSNTGNSIVNFFQGIIDSAKAVVSKESTVKGAFNLATKGEGDHLFAKHDKEVKSLDKAIEYQEMMKANFLKQNPNGNTVNFDNMLSTLRGQQTIATKKRDEAFQTASNVRTQSRMDTSGSLTNEINALEASQSSHIARNRMTAAENLQPQIDALKVRRAALQKTFMGSMDTFSSTLESSELDMPELKEFKSQKLNKKNTILFNANDLDKVLGMKKFTQPPGQIINAPTTNIKEGDTVIPGLSAKPFGDAAYLMAIQMGWGPQTISPH
jgi:hypothetical protein